MYHTEYPGLGLLELNASLPGGKLESLEALTAPLHGFTLHLLR